ncbi:MAG TPA: DUF4331 family protein [Candidatus Dormibacteraeota bacterium]|nr:DUF4331 family protein [Candidatus Dormibacteraeota bacterium]
MADHLDSPNLTSPAMDARVDITDIYAFQKPKDRDKSILILNVNPLAPTHADEFRHDARYELLIDNNGDAQPDVRFSIRFSRKEDGHQFANVRRHGSSDGSDDGEDDDTEDVIEHAPVSFGSTPKVTSDDDYRFFAGLRSDPFFFDLVGFLHGFAFTGVDFFKSLNVFGIVLEVPNRALGPNPQVGVWAHTLIPAMLQPNRLVQVDQMGRPAINTVFNHLNDKVIFNGTQPHDQRGLFLASFVATLESFGYDSAAASNIGDLLLPDILTFDYSSSAGFLNGRQLSDDVIDIELNLVTKGMHATDMVGAHSDYLPRFPYLGTPH